MSGSKLFGGDENEVANEVKRNHVVAARKAFREGDWDRGVRDAKLSNSDNLEVKWYLGMAYRNGKGVSKNDREAFLLFSSVAEQGFPLAQLSLGLCYEDGAGVEKDEQEAVKWFRKAAEQGFRPAQLHLAACYEDGMGLAKDIREAMKWRRLATEYRANTEKDTCLEQLFLGFCYEDGIGVEKDESEAVKWYRKAAGQGLSQAKEALRRLGADQ